MRESNTREIDGVTFTVQQMPVKRSLKLLHRLARAGVPALLKAIGTADLKSIKTIGDLDLSNMGDAAAMLFDKFSAEDLDHVMSELLESSTLMHEGKELPTIKALDIALRGRPMTLFKALAFALEVNYGDFSAAFLDAAGTLGLKSAAAPLKA